MKGVAILTEARSGSEWLGSLTNSTGLFGNSAEWLDTTNLGCKPKSFDDLLSAVIDRGGTANGTFAVKLFPRHLHWSQAKYGADFLAECGRRHAMGLVLLERRDRLRQAISYCRAKASGHWRSTMDGADLVPQYDFAGICQAYFLIEQSYAFWEAYLRLADLHYDHFFYEDLLDDPRPYVASVARQLSMEMPDGEFETNLRLQRDDLTEDWAERFRNDVKSEDLLAHLPRKVAPRNISNLARFLLKKQMRTGQA
ncbi:Stf0 sulfotransferase [Mesorhizobium sp. M00.F.Ca.ET.151.01.1.1]|uniref:Stf0 family sulfotransferase n=2 Tax=unclassified Mesorhizobium TaxID=325217 RepID=UPI000FCBBDA6|nr:MULTISPECIES: Stf0 family sulfotransferase [unclassified Mesorhizobium]RUX04680.1 Stf0 sulfotransferase [Mesorhizobium sp. M8A.F.Ca.ET.023.01.1.1]RVD51160.1 Stf0 sulfotransferase [Mesorhizobium sp. M8A.F.Ca.ET.023.02.2.1]TGQ01457.1 Stf0 sulfotransferase [Mesorhizobium sp. M8A.F.Ca.ET.218.01.1.1]TGQ78567.1 Stf0 sulfotransferase [Mesorhizobium sp. M8A.F.Ca.ET.207.01.1.1]TGQ88099.1 Stf0 sulfotransferase [Mesorhizobium sp. M8A.F.Ca.ET.208.01.1.1]TGR21382.1 Stf0 sulfotransferase [Mesorhizobium 